MAGRRSRTARSGEERDGSAPRITTHPSSATRWPMSWRAGGIASAGTDRHARETRRLFRRQDPHHRFRPVQRPEFRHPPDRRRDAVQGAQPDPAPAARLELLPAGTERGLRHPARLAALRRYTGMPAPPTRCIRTSTSSRATTPNTSSSWPATMSTRWTTRGCCMQHVEQDADVTVGCIEVPRMEAVGFGVMHVDEPTGSSPSWKSRPIRRDAGQAGHGAGEHGHLCLQDQLPDRAVAPRRGGPGSSRDFGQDIMPYLVKHGKAVAHRFTSSCVTSGAEREAYWRDVGTLDAYWEANIDLTAIIPALDLYDRDWPIWTYAEITPPAKFVHEEDRPAGRGDFLAGVRRLHRLGLVPAPVAAVHRRACAFLCAGRAGGDPAGRRYRPRRQAAQCDRRKGRADSRRVLWSARTRKRTPSASAAPSAASA